MQKVFPGHNAVMFLAVVDTSGQATVANTIWLRPIHHYLVMNPARWS